MCNSRPVFRGGRSLQFCVQSSEHQGEPVPTTLDRDGAVALGRKLLAEEERICDRVSEGMVKSSTLKIIEDIASRKSDARLDFSYGVVVDLRNMTFETDRFKHRTRMCLTVCQHGTKSKIWFRTQCIGHRERSDGEWLPPIHYGEQMLGEFFEEAEQIALVALDQLQPIYGEYLQEFVDDGVVALLETVDQFRIKTFDTDSERLPNLFRGLKMGASFTETVGQDLDQRDGSANPAMIAVNLAVPDGKPDQETLNYLRSDESISIVDHASVYGDVGVFIRRTQTDSQTHGRQQDFIGAVYDPDADIGDKLPSQSPAFRLAGEMLAAATDKI